MSEVYFHGGVPGLRVGAKILPPNVTGAPSTASYGAHAVCDRSKVYITTSIEAALMFAAGHPSKRGTVYEVTPHGEVEHDPDCNTRGLSFQCDFATVVRRFRVPGKLLRKARKALVAHSGVVVS